MKRIAILGSTGSIGTQALDVVMQHSDAFSVSVLTAQSNADLLVEQALQFNPSHVVIGDELKYAFVKKALSGTSIQVLAGADALQEVVCLDNVDIVLTALVGYAGLLPTVKAIKAGKPIALANKETLVVAGSLIMPLAREMGVPILPVDSEHSAIFQCLMGESHNPIEKVILTASGGPFRGKKRADLEQVTRAQALKHPNWSMGAKITIDSASLMNKGLEVIEAAWLFDVKASQIDVVVHPQSIVHSLVQFEDGSIKAQLGLPDMKLPIQFALGYPKRMQADFPRFDFRNFASLTFEQPDLETFRNLGLAFQALDQGGNMPCILNAANEVAVAAFLKDEIGFLEMSDLLADCMAKGTFLLNPSLEDYITTDKLTREMAQLWVKQQNK
ncbi:1-deoxy-D-xylulose-5-phosphate reductoisomerase [Aquirufa regiilacus]|uniref:1-deoxy-D-xylulose 5-phosphate reductoisomerase n=1 Tax=Aquirufa regiilacus TaxID=3024868 RepID=A0ABU3TSN1_9BACT|nr:MULTISPECIES: 1-deoxy-D-xylulose-5-phosphate reductoisomerase [unclassified Aquirufa]MDT8886551.1 1-deoxy-D-xylulose-5-phosphate reductoisomerase [Aquirufa sp. LEPPI-3A]MDU0808881.1 1-deoxy-D-xylulose-5-phosphate reductoisomerase [Aquirufa sp. LEOWEIH-7C]